MIMFDKDWRDYPLAISHTSTRNRTWVRMAVAYKEHFKLKNWRFHLALLDPDLEHVDPFDPDLNEITKLKIIAECENNPWYFYREIMKIPPKAGIEPSMFRVDRGTLATLWCYHNHMDTTNIQLRQTGKTIKIEAVAIWLLVAGARNTTILYGTVDVAKQQDCVRSIKAKLALLPEYLYKPIKGKDSDNRGTITNVRRENYIQFAIGQKEKRVARQAGRGYSLANKIWDEVAETINAHESISAASGSSNAVIDEARMKGEPYGTIYACTAGSIDRPEGEFYYNLAMSGLTWTELLLDSEDQEDLYTTVGRGSADELAPLVDITMSWRQLGLDERRFREIVALSKREANGDLDKVKRECYSIWGRGGILNPLTKEQLTTIFESEREPKRVEKTKDRILMRWYKSKDEIIQLASEKRIGIGIDTSNGIGRDACSITVTDLATLETLGRSDISSVNLQTYADFVCWLVILLGDPIVVIENKASGQGIIDALIIRLHNLGIDVFRVLFNRIYQDPDKYSRYFDIIINTPVRKRNVAWYNQFKGYMGFSTSSNLRQDLYGTVLEEAIRMAGSRVYDTKLSMQLRTLEEKNGRIDHATKGHDDAVMSWLFICWFCLFGRNFKRYGIKAGTVLSLTVRTESGSYSDEDLAKQQEINYLNGLLPTLEEQYRLNYDNHYGAAMRIRIERVHNELDILGVTAPASLDDYFLKLTAEK